jgi:hypothetical protein
MNETAYQVIAPAELPPGLLETHVQSRLGGRIKDLQLVVQDQGLILRGHARTYYAKQLAQQAVMQATELPILSNDIEVS